MKSKFLLTIASVALLASSCNSKMETESGKGTLILSLSNSPCFEETKALSENMYRNTDYYDVVVTNANGKEMLKCKGGELSIKTPKELDMGTYKVIASYGHEFDASRDDFYVEGLATIVMQPKEQRNVEIICEPTCGKVSANFDSAMDTYYSEYSVEYGGTEALGTKKVVFAKGETAPWYIKLAPEGETISYTIRLKAKDAYQVTDAQGNAKKEAEVSGTFNLKRNKAHKLTIKPNYTPQTDGGMGLTITIDESTEERNVNIEVPVSWI